MSYATKHNRTLDKAKRSRYALRHPSRTHRAAFCKDRDSHALQVRLGMTKNLRLAVRQATSIWTKEAFAIFYVDIFIFFRHAMSIVLVK